jgi:hypothetical protein
MWVIAVRLNDRQHLYFNACLDRQGQSEWTSRINQAQRFELAAEATNVAAAFDTNASAKEYEVLRLAPQ